MSTCNSPYTVFASRAIACSRYQAMHRGVSLVEILMSIGVLLVGLLGVIALIPAAQHRAEQAVQEDRKALAGRRALREFQIRDMEETSNWFYNPNFADPDNPQQSFCLDPRHFNAETLLNNPNSPSWQFPLGGNPYTKAPLGFMQRITLKRDSASPNREPMMPFQAEPLFAFEDDLVFERPADVSLPTEQTVLGVDNGPDGIVNEQNDIPWKRLATGQFSWMATLVPEPHVGSNLYHLSIVVFNRRIADPALNQAPETVGENVVKVRQHLGAGLSGGDVRLGEEVDSLPAWLHLQDLRAGDWLLLHQSRPKAITAAGPSSNELVAYFRWYRVVATDESPNLKTLPNRPLRQRTLSLQGPDWIPQPDDSAILVRNVVAVYEKSIRLEH